MNLIVDQKKFIQKIYFLLLLILLIKIWGFFTLSENVAITRVLKVFMRIGMTVSLYYLNNYIVKKTKKISLQLWNPLSFYFYLLYLLLGLISIMWSTDPGYSMLQWVMATESLVFAFLLIKILLTIKYNFSESSVRISFLFAVSCFSILLVFVVGKFFFPSVFFRLVQGGEESRLGGNLMNPNELGMLSSLGLGTCFLELRYAKTKWWVFLFIGVLLYALIITGSRSSLVGIFILIIYSVYHSSNRFLKLGTVVGAIAAFPVVVAKLFIRQGGFDEVLSMTGRLPFWKALITEDLPREPLFGFGFMRIAYKDTFESVHTYAGHMTHNTFIQVLMNLGFVGLFIVLLQIACTFYSFFQTNDFYKKTFFLSLFIPIVINSFTEFGIFGEANYGILFYQILICWLMLEKKKSLVEIKEMNRIEAENRLSKRFRKKVESKNNY